MTWWKLLLLIVGSYLIGNIFFARIISRHKKYDISSAGSGNPGTMNMLRNFGIGIGFLTLVLDMLKGVIPAIVGYYLFGGASGGTDAIVGIFVGGLSALVGNIFPVFYKFKGGKGAAVVYGMYCVAQPILGIIIFFGGLLYFMFFDYASLLSVLMITIFTLYEAYALGIMFGTSNLLLSCLLFAVFFLTIFGHRANIFRLLVGKENRMNFKQKLMNLKKKKLSKDQKKELKQKEIG